MRKANKLVIIVSAVMFASFGLTLRSFGRSQNSNSSTTTPRQSQQSPSPQQDFSRNTWELPEDADKTKNPVAATPESVTKGKELFLTREKGNCISVTVKRDPETKPIYRGFAENLPTSPTKNA